MNKIIIVGSNSYISQRLIKKLKIEKINHETVSSTSKKSDFKLDLQNVNNFDFRKIKKNDFIIFLAAISSPDLCHKV